MESVFKFPDVGEGIHEGTIVKWLVKEGDQIKEDEPLVSVETDKAVVDIPSPKTGKVKKVHSKEKDLIHVGDDLVTFEVAGQQKTPPNEFPSPRPSEPEKQQPTVLPTPEKQPTEIPGQPSEYPEKQPPEIPDGQARRPSATPRIRHLARELGINLTFVKGSGAHGQITEGDLKNYQAKPVEAKGEAAQPVQEIPRSDGISKLYEQPVERVAISHLRATIAKNMKASVGRSPHVTHVDEADVTDLVNYQKSLKEIVEKEYSLNLTLLPFFIKAVVANLKDFPKFNSSADLEKNEMLIKRHYNIGIAIDTAEGLIVPNIKNADQKDIITLVRESLDLANRAKERKLHLDELKGGTCTITNIGPLGGLFATPIINPPELCIIGIHSIKERPVAREGQVLIRKMMYLSVTFDHQFIDGADAARFMSKLVQLLENPNRLIMRW